MAAWQDCQWRRKPCGKDECPICGGIKRDRAELAVQGEDPDSMESALKMVGKTMAETLGLLYKQAEEMGIGLENPDDVEMLQDLVLAAVNDALKKSQEMVSGEMGKLTGGLSLNIPGLF